MFLVGQGNVSGLCVCASDCQDLLSLCIQRLASNLGIQSIVYICVYFYGPVDDSLCRIPASDWTLFAKFFTNAENTYVKEKRALKFIPDLLKIHVPGLVDASTKDSRLFKTSVRFFINIHASKEGVMDEVQAMLVQHINSCNICSLLMFMYECMCMYICMYTTQGFSALLYQYVQL